MSIEIGRNGPAGDILPTFIVQMRICQRFSSTEAVLLDDGNGPETSGHSVMSERRRAEMAPVATLLLRSHSDRNATIRGRALFLTGARRACGPPCRLLL